MTDKEKIEQIILDKHLNSTQFCSEVCIAPGTLSHIRSGRTEPTLNILRSISQAFPDINPAWLFYGEGSMYKNQDSPTPENQDGDDTYLNSHVGDEAPIEDSQLSFAFPTNAPQSFKGAVANVNTSSSVPSSSSGTVNPRRSPMTASTSSPVSVQEIVAETLKQQQKPQRKVVEVRIFFDDGTFETFSAK